MSSIIRQRRGLSWAIGKPLKGWALKTLNPLRQEAAVTTTPQMPRQRLRCVPGMLNSSEVKVFHPT